MKLATLRNDTRDGELIVVSRDLTRYAGAGDVAPTLQAALDDWDAVSPRLEERYLELQSGGVDGVSLATDRLAAPLPRAYEWIDGSAYINHIVLVRKARGAEPPETLETDPLVYQGGSGVLLGPADDIPFVDPAWGLDFEAEVVVILGDTPRATSSTDALGHVRLVTICNDVSLRGLIPGELKKNFGFFVSKPATAFGPIAVTPDELGDAWQEGRVHLPLRSTLNGKVIGDTEAGPEMHFSFGELIGHVTQSRALTAGTLLGSGTVSNMDEARGVSCLAERRMRETIASGSPTTPFLQPGDRIEIEMLDRDGNTIFGRISQCVVEEK